MKHSSARATLVVVMGVSGCGKSSIAAALAQEHNFEFVEADDFHPEINIQHMASGNALTDAMREPWITLIQNHLKQSFNAGRDCVLSFSGLRRRHRARLRELECEAIFIHLKGEQSLIADRIYNRAKHFMPCSLLSSQFAALEEPAKTEQLIEVDISKPLIDVVASASQALNANLNALQIDQNSQNVET